METELFLCSVKLQYFVFINMFNIILLFFFVLFRFTERKTKSIDRCFVEEQLLTTYEE